MLKLMHTNYISPLNKYIDRCLLHPGSANKQRQKIIIIVLIEWRYRLKYNWNCIIINPIHFDIIRFEWDCRSYCYVWWKWQRMESFIIDCKHSHVPPDFKTCAFHITPTPTSSPSSHHIAMHLKHCQRIFCVVKTFSEKKPQQNNACVEDFIVAKFEFSEVEIALSSSLIFRELWKLSLFYFSHSFFIDVLPFSSNNVNDLMRYEQVV